MPIQVDLYEVVARGRFLLPDACPHCKESFVGSESPLREWQWEDVGERVTVEGETTQMLGDKRYGDEFLPCAYWCDACGKELTLEKAPPLKEEEDAGTNATDRAGG